MTEKMSSIIRISKIESLKTFQRLKDKTQVLIPDTDTDDTIMNRLTHSYVVKTGSTIIAETIKDTGLNVDYKNAISTAALTHDIGIPMGGHEGQRIIDQKIRELGLTEGFDDNNNNLVVLKKTGAFDFLTDYEIASIIKYPKKLYPSQKPYFENLLNRAIDEDIRYFESQKIKITKRPTRTIACEIMDEADRNSYVTSDLIDAFILGITDHQPIEELISKDLFHDTEIKGLLYSILTSVKLKDKNLIRRSFNNLFISLNSNYYIGDNIELLPKNKELILLREELFKIENELFINSKLVLDQRDQMSEIMTDYIDYVIENEHYPSETYKKLIMKSKTKKERLMNIRDMLGETTDRYVLKFQK